jgi:hypothetical protein
MSTSAALSHLDERFVPAIPVEYEIYEFVLL